MGKLDVALKHTLTAHAADWARFVGVPDGVPVEAVDIDLSAVLQMADKLLRVHADPAYLLHIEPQSYCDDDLDSRILQYQCTARHREGLDVHSIALLLYPRAWGPKNNGGIRSRSPFPGCRLEFDYHVIRVWELPVESILRAGVGLLPLAPLADVTPEHVHAVIAAMTQRLSVEVPRAEAGELWTATHLLMGVKYGRELTNLLLRSVRSIMQESPTYQEIVEEGIEKGIEKGTTQAMQATLLRQGRHRFGRPSRAIQRRIQALSNHALLDALLVRILDVDTWDELFQDVDGGK